MEKGGPHSSRPPAGPRPTLPSRRRPPAGPPPTPESPPLLLMPSLLDAFDSDLLQRIAWALDPSSSPSWLWALAQDEDDADILPCELAEEPYAEELLQRFPSLQTYYEAGQVGEILAEVCGSPVLMVLAANPFFSYKDLRQFHEPNASFTSLRRVFFLLNPNAPGDFASLSDPSIIATHEEIVRDFLSQHEDLFPLDWPRLAILLQTLHEVFPEKEMLPGILKDDLDFTEESLLGNPRQDEWDLMLSTFGVLNTTSRLVRDVIQEDGNEEKIRQNLQLILRHFGRTHESLARITHCLMLCRDRMGLAPLPLLLERVL